jgi:ribosomal protein S18 acetylase RimI-like enzyme
MLFLLAGEIMTDFIKVQDPKQIKQTATLAQKIWTKHYTPIIGSSQVKYMLENFQSFEAIKKQIENDDYHYYLVWEKSKLIGYFAFKFKRNEMFLSKIYLTQEARGKGIARRIIDFLVEQTQNQKLKQIRLTVNKNNSNSIAIYQKLGFKKTDAIVTDIGQGYVMDDFVLVRTI